MNKDLFYKKMQPFFESGLAREIYSSDQVCMLSFGEICYVGCTYELMDGSPIGVFMSPDVMKNIVKENRQIYPLLQVMFNDFDRFKGMIFDFSQDINIWKNWIIENKNNNVSTIDYQLEEEIAKISKDKLK